MLHIHTPHTGFKTLTDTFGGTLHALGGEATTSMQNDGVEEGVGDDDGAVAADAQASSSPTASDVSSQELQLEAAQHDDGGMCCGMSEDE